MRITGLARVVFGVCVVGALALTLSSGCDRGTGSGGGGAAKPKVVYITNGVADFWTLAKVGAQTAAKDVNADVEVLMPKDIEQQQRMVQDSLTRGVDGIAISPINSANQGDLINDAAARTKVITHDSDAPNTKRLAYIGMSNYDAGRMCGKLVKEALPEGGSVIIMVGRPEQDNAGLRRQGVIDELLDRPNKPEARDPVSGGEIKGEKYTILATMTDQFERPIAKRNATDAMNKYDNIGAMVGLFEYNPPMILEALGDKAGKEIKVIGFDEAQTTLQAIKDGRCHGTIVQDPYRYGYESVKMLAALTRGDQSVVPASGFLDIPAKAIKKDNVEAFQAEMNKRLGK